MMFIIIKENPDKLKFAFVALALWSLIAFASICSRESIAFPADNF